MNIEFSLVKGLAFGLEYVDLDEQDQAELETEGSMMVVISLAFLRFVFY